MSDKQGKVVSVAEHQAAHAAHDAAHDTAHEIRIYLTIFGALILLTLATVGVAYMALPHAASIVIALLIAFAKVFLIASFFMHLMHEGRLINWSLAVCVFALLIFVLFTMPDLGVHPAEQAARLSIEEAEKVFHEAIANGGPVAGAEAHH
jgi:cytochrome c oxidase subunit IV